MAGMGGPGGPVQQSNMPNQGHGMQNQPNLQYGNNNGQPMNNNFQQRY